MLFIIIAFKSNKSLHPGAPRRRDAPKELGVGIGIRSPGDERLGSTYCQRYPWLRSALSVTHRQALAVAARQPEKKKKTMAEKNNSLRFRIPLFPVNHEGTQNKALFFSKLKSILINGWNRSNKPARWSTPEITSIRGGSAQPSAETESGKPDLTLEQMLPAGTISNLSKLTGFIIVSI